MPGVIEDIRRAIETIKDIWAKVARGDRERGSAERVSRCASEKRKESKELDGDRASCCLALSQKLHGESFSTLDTICLIV